jgi:hypothetical protein
MIRPLHQCHGIVITSIRMNAINLTWSQSFIFPLIFTQSTWRMTGVQSTSGSWNKHAVLHLMSVCRTSCTYSLSVCSSTQHRKGKKGWWRDEKLRKKSSTALQQQHKTFMKRNMKKSITSTTTNRSIFVTIFFWNGDPWQIHMGYTRIIHRFSGRVP